MCLLFCVRFGDENRQNEGETGRFLLELSGSRHGNRLLPPSCTPVYFVYSYPVPLFLPLSVSSLPPTLPLLSSLLYPSIFAAFPSPLIIQISFCVSLAARHISLQLVSNLTYFHTCLPLSSRLFSPRQMFDSVSRHQRSLQWPGRE